MPIATRYHHERDSISASHSSCRTSHRTKIVSTGFSGLWSVIAPNSLGPCPRTGHFTVYDEPNHLAYVGHGLTADNTTLFDCWVVDLFTLTWKRLPLHGETLPGRTGTRGALVGKHLVLFGGYSDPIYFGDLHTINIETGEVKVVVTTGPLPTSRSTPIVTAYSGRLYVWGGFNGAWPTELSVLDFSNMSWHVHEQNIAGRTAVPHIIVDNFLYSYGGSKSGGMIALNLDTFSMEVRPTAGAEPPRGVIGSGMVRAGRFAFFFGGRDVTRSTLMYACDLTRMWWFVFHVAPDGETVSAADGMISEAGLFLLPRIHSYGMCYLPQTKQIVAFLGAPEKEPPPFFMVDIGEAMAIINLRDDLIAALGRS
jgi:hypothetical protein